MAQQTVSIGSSANDGTGDPLRTAFTKINANFTELYGSTLDRVSLDLSPQLGGDLDINGHNIISARTNENIRIIPAGTGTVELESNVNVTGNLVATGDITANGNINLGDAAGDQVKVTGVFEADQLQIDGTTLTSTVTNGDVTITGNASGGVVVENFSFNDSTITSPSNSDISIQPGGTGNLVLGSITLEMNNVGTQIVSNDSTQVVFGEDVSVNGALSSASLALATGATVTGIDNGSLGTSATLLATQGAIKTYADTKTALTGSTNNQVTTVTGAHAVQGEANLTFDGSTLAVTGAGTFSTTLGVTGTLTTADITTTGTHSVTGTLNADYVQLKDNKITTNASNAILEISANGTGTIDVQSAMTTIGQTVTGTVSVTGQLNADNIRIDGNVISATTGGITLTPAANQNVALGGIATANEIHATLAEITTLRTDKLEIDTSDGDMSINTQGTGTLDFNTPTQSTIGSAGGASALPGAPTGYLKVKVAGTLRVIPYWDQA